jgi:hypothetical protein
MTTAKTTARRSPRKRPSPEAIEVARRVNTLPKKIQRRIAKIAKNGEIDSDETVMITNNIDSVSTAPRLSVNESIDVMEVIRRELQSASKLSTAAALALRAENGGDVRDGVRGIITAAKAALNHAQEEIDVARVGELAFSTDLDQIDQSVLHLYGSLIVIEFSLSAEAPIGGEGIVDHPIADALDVVAAAAGSDRDEGLNGQADQLVRALRSGEKLQ